MSDRISSAILNEFNTFVFCIIAQNVEFVCCISFLVLMLIQFDYDDAYLPTHRDEKF